MFRTLKVLPQAVTWQHHVVRTRECDVREATRGVLDGEYDILESERGAITNYDGAMDSERTAGERR